MTYEAFLVLPIDDDEGEEILLGAGESVDDTVEDVEKVLRRFRLTLFNCSTGEYHKWPNGKTERTICAELCSANTKGEQNNA